VVGNYSRTGAVPFKVIGKKGRVKSKPLRRISASFPLHPKELVLFHPFLERGSLRLTISVAKNLKGQAPLLPGTGKCMKFIKAKFQSGSMAPSEPHWAIATHKPTVDKATVFPPILGPGL